MLSYFKKLYDKAAGWFAIRSQKETLAKIAKAFDHRSPIHGLRLALEASSWVTPREPELSTRRSSSIRTHHRNIQALLSTCKTVARLIEAGDSIPYDIAQLPDPAARLIDEFYLTDDGYSVSVAAVSTSVLQRTRQLLSLLDNLEVNDEAKHSYYIRKVELTLVDLYRVHYHILGTNLSQ